MLSLPCVARACAASALAQRPPRRAGAACLETAAAAESGGQLLPSSAQLPLRGSPLVGAPRPLPRPPPAADAAERLALLEVPRLSTGSLYAHKETELARQLRHYRQRVRSVRKQFAEEVAQAQRQSARLRTMQQLEQGQALQTRRLAQHRNAQERERLAAELHARRMAATQVRRQKAMELQRQHDEKVRARAMARVDELRRAVPSFVGLDVAEERLRERLLLALTARHAYDTLPQPLLSASPAPPAPP